MSSPSLEAAAHCATGYCIVLYCIEEAAAHCATWPLIRSVAEAVAKIFPRLPAVCRFFSRLNGKYCVFIRCNIYHSTGRLAKRSARPIDAIISLISCIANNQYNAFCGRQTSERDSEPCTCEIAPGYLQ